MNRKTLWVAALALLAASLNAWASEIVNAAYVADAAKRGAIIWDVRGPGDYAKGHIPGAITLGNAGNVLRNPNTEDFVPTAEVQKLFNAAGLDLSREVIVYSRAGDPYAYWGLTAVKYFGGKNGKVFHGGLDEWQAAGQPVAKEPTRLQPVDQMLKVDPTVQIMLPEVLTKVGKADVQFIDARTPKEYSGDDIRALRGGHIPGAKNIPYEQNWTDPATAAKLAKGEVKTRDGMALKSPEQLKALYAGVDPDKETIVYCQSGVRASETAAVLRSLGFNNVRVFEESWLGYGNNFAAPADGVQFVNVGALNSKIKSLEGDVETLTAEVEALKAAKK
jgi:thiosulfate/3-mercaptopyruvate sulfurtransferase